MHSKASIRAHFNEAAPQYDHEAGIAVLTATELARTVRGAIPYMPGTMVELGCGTGIFTQQLAPYFPHTMYLATDLSEGMLRQCKHKLHTTMPWIHYAVLDAELLTLSVPSDCMVANMVFQFFTHPTQMIPQLFEQTDRLIFSLPIDGTLARWYQAHQGLGLQHHLRPLLTQEALHQLCQACTPYRYRVVVQHYTLQAPTPEEFWKPLMHLGIYLTDHVQYQEVAERLHYMHHGLDLFYTIAYCVLEKQT